MLEPILSRFGDYLRAIPLHAPRLPIISNRTGAALLDSEATDPDYWVQHLRNTVLFADGITTLSQESARVYLEVGPGKALSSLVKMHGQVKPDKVLPSLRHPEDDIVDDAWFLTVLGQLWACGVDVDFEQYRGGIPRQKVVLPSYAFQRSRYFIEPGQARIEAPDDPLMRLEDSADWTWAPACENCARRATGRWNRRRRRRGWRGRSGAVRRSLRAGSAARAYCPGTAAAWRAAGRSAARCRADRAYRGAAGGRARRGRGGRRRAGAPFGAPAAGGDRLHRDTGDGRQRCATRRLGELRVVRRVPDTGARRFGRFDH